METKMENENKTTQPQPYGETKEEMPQVEVANEEQLPVWMQRMPSGNLLVKTSQGDYEVADVPYEEVMKARKRITRGENIDVDKFEIALISTSLVSPKLGELDLIKLKGSTVMKLRGAIYKMYDINSFLSI